jgi:hypothetical protein
MAGPKVQFNGTAQNGIYSRSFPSWYPKSFEFRQAPDNKHCTDTRSSIMGFVIVSLFLGVIFLQLQPAALFVYILGCGWLYVAFGSDPVSVTKPDLALQHSVTGLGVVISAGFFFYNIAAKYTLVVRGTDGVALCAPLLNSRCLKLKQHLKKRVAPRVRDTSEAAAVDGQAAAVDGQAAGVDGPPTTAIALAEIPSVAVSVAHFEDVAEEEVSGVSNHARVQTERHQEAKPSEQAESQTTGGMTSSPDSILLRVQQSWHRWFYEPLPPSMSSMSTAMWYCVPYVLALSMNLFTFVDPALNVDIAENFLQVCSWFLCILILPVHTTSALSLVAFAA